MEQLLIALQTLGPVQIFIVVVVMLVGGGGLVKIIEALFNRLTNREKTQAGLQETIDNRAASMLEDFTNRQTLEIDRLTKAKEELEGEARKLSRENDIYRNNIFRSLGAVYQTKSLLELLVHQMDKSQVRQHKTVLLRIEEQISTASSEMEAVRAMVLTGEPGVPGMDPSDLPDADEAESSIRRAIGDIPSEISEASEGQGERNETSSSSESP